MNQSHLTEITGMDMHRSDRTYLKTGPHIVIQAVQLLQNVFIMYIFKGLNKLSDLQAFVQLFHIFLLHVDLQAVGEVMSLVTQFLLNQHQWDFLANVTQTQTGYVQVSSMLWIYSVVACVCGCVCLRVCLGFINKCTDAVKPVYLYVNSI